MSVLALYDSQFSAAQIVAKTGYGQIFIDSADGALKWKDGAGNLSTIGAGVGGTGLTGRMAEFLDAGTLQASTLIKSGAGVLTLSAGGAYTLTVPETGTPALLGTANIFASGQVVGNGSGAAVLTVNGGAGSGRNIDLQTGGVGRWTVRANTTAESGSNAGSNFEIIARDDAGAVLSIPLAIARSTGIPTFSSAAPVFGSFTLTIPATGTAALLATANVFSANQRVDALVGVNAAPTAGQQVTILGGATTTIPLVVDTPSGQTAACQDWQLNSVQRATMFLASNGSTFRLLGHDNGTGRGTRYVSDRNNNASTPAAGHIMLENLGATNYRIWPDATGLLRIHTADPTNANDTAGTIVGTQTSYEAAKLLDVEKPDLRESLRHVVETASQLYGFRYKNGAYNNEHYPVGIVTDFSPRYGQDRSIDFPQGKSLNLPVAVGDLFASIAVIDQRLTRLEEQWARLRLRLAP